MGSIDCVDKVCFLTYQLLETCVVYLHPNSSRCEIPCKLDGCQINILNGVECPLWHCNFYTTPSPIDPITTEPPQPQPTRNIFETVMLAIIGSFVLGVMFIVFLKKYQLGLRFFRATIQRLQRREPPSSPTAFVDSFDLTDLSTNQPTFGAEILSSLINSENEQPQRDFFPITLEDETESGINFLNFTPPGEPSNWHFHSVAGRFTEAAREVFQNASDRLPRESFKNFFKKSDYDQI
jgi:hypothetical protein